ncbi:gamma carbonic anhydrase family protein [Rosenbergiella australiborealis]|uniref:Gamma carbonic anhydrase family protein n=1 Tax=Rosenbergiella australiborealis TaxID=1544696 RepID=A0ABS5T8F4_9GAMM|nr:gamma carbonic anhydrase family protein [Rosenbergiella australiborealis]MBT0727243.1 gamma carbonic anhydrase family protein [Rosenbergiella australiborealis]
MQNSLRAFNGHTPKIGQEVMIDPSAVIIGNVIIKDHSSIWPLVVIRGDVNTITIGMRTNIQDGSVLHVTHRSQKNPSGYPLIIGNDVTIGHKVMLHGCSIGNRVIVGMGSILLDGAEIEDDVLIGAGSLIPPRKRLSSGFLYLGNPVRQIRQLTAEEIHSLKQSSDNYRDWKQIYLDNQ